jgi:hypothetical protein
MERVERAQGCREGFGAPAEDGGMYCDELEAIEQAQDAGAPRRHDVIGERVTDPRPIDRPECLHPCELAHLARSVVGHVVSGPGSPSATRKSIDVST